MLEGINMRIFKGNKWNQWYESLPENYKIYLENQGKYYESHNTNDIIASLAIGFIIGLGLGFWLFIK